jgi:hypothetical protein
MKNAIILLLFFVVCGQKNGLSQQTDRYKKNWIKIDSLEKSGLYRSALNEAKKIYTDAARYHDDQQQIKALIYQLKYRDKIEDNSLVNNIRETDSLMQEAAGMQKAVLQSMLAEMFLRYAQYNRYALYNRVTSVAENEKDITTWSLVHLYDQITTLYTSSLQDTTLLKKADLKDFSVIVDTGKHALNLQPTLYDLLAHRALNFFTSEEQDVIKPAQHFMINQASMFEPAFPFSNARLPDQDTMSLSYYALYLYQQLLRFHLQDHDPAALIDADLQRLQFVYRKAVLADKDSLYKMALRHIIDQYGNHPATAEASYLLAQWYFQKGSQYDADSHPGCRSCLRKAIEICINVAPYPLTSGSLSCRRLKDNILRSDISLQAEHVNIPQKPFRVLVTYKNISRLWFRVVKLPEDPKAVFSNRDPRLAYLSKEKSVKSWMQAFPDPGDYQSHRTEMKVDGLPPGRYALLVSGNASFSEGKFPVESAVFYVSGISYIQNGAGDYLVLNRETGRPLANATVRLWSTRYNTAARANELNLVKQVITDQRGGFKLSADKNSYNIMPEISWKNDHLFTGMPQWIPLASSNREDKDTTVQKTYLFTDRSIYRPGQTVYFKGITFGFNPATHQSKVIKDKKVAVFLINSNGQRADSLDLVSNDFGSYNGMFVLPKGLLNGYMHLETSDHNATAYFSVEDYKRPSFYLQWDTTSHEYRLGDTVNVSGRVMAYSQAVIDGATVKYQVMRRTRILYPWLRRNAGLIIPPRSEAASITQGIAITDDKGNFNINFPAIPDESMDSTLMPVFIYEVSADVTDINGESHHFSYELPLGYQSIELQLNIPDKISLQQMDTVDLSATNLFGKFIPTPVIIRVYPLAAPERYIRKRYWPQPDQFIIDKAAYLKYFPHDEYKDESDPAAWNKGKALLSMSDTTRTDGKIALHPGNLKPGWYAIEVNAKDKYGRLTSITKYVQVYDENMVKPVFTDPLWVSANELDVQPGNKAAWILSSGDQADIMMQDERLEKTDAIKNELLNNSIKHVVLPVNEDDWGGIIRHYVAVRYNRVFTEDVRIKVPWEDKQLHIRYETFRDKLLPGAQEHWKMKITGEGGEKISAELLASMYDASLDAFRPHQWEQPDIYPVIYGKVNWGNGQTFNSVLSYNLFNPKPRQYPNFEKIYPSLNWFGYNPRYRIYPPGPVMYKMNAGIVSDEQSMKRTAADKAQLQETVVGYAEDTAADINRQPLETMPVRKNFNETAFFLPQLHTDDSGNVVFSFTMPEVLTRWKLMMFAHTKDMRFASSERETVTQKPLMIQANAPRFVRQGDQLIFSAKVNNLSEEDLQGNAELTLADAVTGQQVNDLFSNKNTVRPFRVNAGQSTVIKWTMDVPENYTDVLSYTVTAAAGDYRDGEQNALPVLTNRTLVTESLPLNFLGNGVHHLSLDVLKIVKQSSTVQPQGMTIEYTGNPIWYAVQALPFLDESKQPSTDALFNHFYANALSGFIATHIPHFDEIRQQWLTKDTNALKSPLQENEDLKTVLLEETPWVEAAQDESALKMKIAQWFDGKEAKERMHESISKLEKMQLSNGGFSWFEDMPDDRYITQRIITGIGHLKKLNAWPEEDTNILAAIVQKAIPYLDARMKDAYNKILKDSIKDPELNPGDIQYLYMRSFFPEINRADSVKEAYSFYEKLAEKNWNNQTIYLQAMIALALYRSGNIAVAGAILKSLSERAIKDPLRGMHWKDAQAYYWYQAPVETQAVCIEAFDEIRHDEATVNDLRIWLLTQKQTRHWVTHNATADAVYALLLRGGQWTASSPEVNITTGNKSFVFNRTTGEAGTQYSRVYIPGKEITPAMGSVDVKIKDAAKDQPSWGALYFQYFENMNRLKNSSSGVSISREISLEKTTPKGPQLIPVNDQTNLRVGDKVQVRLIIKTDRDMDYVHLKDVRASCMEPLQTLSGYHWNAGSGYYSTVTDAAMHYYFSHLPRGTYVLSYPVYITHAGNYTGGMSELECLYAPAFRAHSEGVNIEISEK